MNTNSCELLCSGVGSVLHGGVRASRAIVHGMAGEISLFLSNRFGNFLAGM